MTGEAAAGSPSRAPRQPIDRALPGRLARLRGTALVVPGVAWLLLFFVIPLGIIFVVSLGHRDALDRVDLSSPSLDNYARV